MTPRITVFVACLALATFVLSCGRQLNPLAIPNQPPSIMLSATVDSAGGSPLAHLTWTATDPDGRVDHFLVAHDPASLEHVDAGWEHTSEHTRIVPLRARAAGALRAATHVRPYETVAVRAVDDRGAMSPPATETFFGTDIAPTVRFVQPNATTVYEAIGVDRLFPRNLHVSWAGADPDAPRGQPWQYKLRVFSRKHEPVLYRTVALNPDTIATLFGPAFEGWQTFRGDSTGTTLTGLTVDDHILIAVTALDREGAYDPAFSFDRNMLYGTVVDFPGLGPILLLHGPQFQFGYPSGGLDWRVALDVPVAPGIPETIAWTAVPQPESGNPIAGFRWAVDLADSLDESTRRNALDLTHWSAWSPTATSVTLDPFAPGETHQLYVEARDVGGATSLAHLRFEAPPRPASVADLLIVNDTRYTPDRVLRGLPGHPDSIQAPSGIWPNAAELDTFLFARGGVRWRMTPNGTLSHPGIFAGYAYDTLGTRTGAADPTVPLATLQRYRHVIWLVDANGATYSPNELGNGPSSALLPETALRWMSEPNHVNTLAAYVEGGGDVWLLGGGPAYATLSDRNYRYNDTQYKLFTSTGTRPDLLPGEFMYDLARWQSAIEIAPFLPTGTRIVRWSSDLSLPAELGPKTPATDPIFPLRTFAEFYDPRIGSGLEWIAAPNNTGDPRNPSPRHTMDIRVLDTLLVASDGGRVVDRVPSLGDAGLAPVMTVAHSGTQGCVIFSGFDIWHFHRDECVQLVDAVLHGMWGMNRSTPPAPPAPHATGTYAARRR